MYHRDGVGTVYFWVIKTQVTIQFISIFPLYLSFKLQVYAVLRQKSKILAHEICLALHFACQEGRQQDMTDDILSLLKSFL